MFSVFQNPDKDTGYAWNMCFGCPYEDECRCDNSCGCAAGEPGCGIVEDVNLRLHEILDPTNRENGDVLQFVQVTFSTGTDYEADTPYDPATGLGGAVILSSVQIGQGQVWSSNLLQQGCVESSTTNNLINAAMVDAYTGRLSNECAPSAHFCKNVPDLEDRFVTLNIPLGANYFNQLGSTLTSSTSIFVEFVVKLKKIGGTGGPVLKTVKAQIPVVRGGVNTWCAARTEAIGLDDVASVDIMIGSAMDYSELSRLQIMTDIASTDDSNVNSVELNSASIESGLLTLILKGNSSFFEQDRTGRFRLEIEDIISLHLMENGNTAIFNDLLTMATAGTAFDIVADRWGHHAEMKPTTDLMNKCSFFPTPPSTANLLPHVCVARRDIRHRVPTTIPGSAGPTAMEIRHDANDAELEKQKSFMKSIFLDSDYAERLGTSFADNVVRKWGVNSRYVRAFWINPGYEWTPTSVVGAFSRFTISQKIIVFVLINLNEDFMRRRMILQTGANEQNRGTGQAMITNNIDQADILAQVVGVDKSNIVGLEVVMGLTDQEACYSEANLREILKPKLERALENAAQPSNGFLAQGLQITGISVDRSTVRCAGTRRTVASRTLLGTASAAVNALVAADPTKNVKINLGQLQEQEGINSVKRVAGECTFCTNEPVDSTKIADDTKSAADKQDDSDDDSDSNSNTVIIAAVCGSIGGVLVIVAGFMAWRMSNKQSQTSNVNVVEAVSLADLKSQLASEVSSP